MADSAGQARDPSGFLSDIIGAEVTIKLNSGTLYKGRCEKWLMQSSSHGPQPACYLLVLTGV